MISPAFILSLFFIACAVGSMGSSASPVPATPSRTPLAATGNGVALTLTLSFVYPDHVLAGRRLFLRGDSLSLNWNSGVLMQHTAIDTWSFTLSFALPVEKLAPSSSSSSSSSSSPTEHTSSTPPSPSAKLLVLQCKALVEDSVWQIGANAVVEIPSVEAERGVLSYTFTAPVIYPFFFNTRGYYQYVRNVYSPQLDNTRDLVVYVPPSYVENTLKTYPVLIMHDGQNLFNDSTSFTGVSWRCQDTVDGLVYEGGMEEIIIVGVDNTPNRTYELTYSYDPSEQAGGGGDLYLDFLHDTVLPLATSMFRIDTGASSSHGGGGNAMKGAHSHTVTRLGDSSKTDAPPVPGLGILGSSLGGLISCYAGYARGGFDRVGCMSSSFWWNSEDFNNSILNKASHANPNTLFYLDSGDAGPSQDDVLQTRRVLAHMEQKGYTLNQTLFYFLDRGGQHSEVYWGRRFYVPMSYLYAPRAVAATIAAVSTGTSADTGAALLS